MMLATARGNRRTAEFAFNNSAFDSSVPIPRASQYGGSSSYAGKRVTFAEAAGLPAFLRGVRLISETTAMMPIGVSRGYGRERRPVVDAPQLRVLHRPNDDMTRFEVWAFTLVALIRGNAYLYKQLDGHGQVEALWPLSPEWVIPRYESGKPPQFKVREGSGVAQRTFTDREILHIPGLLLDDRNIGVSVVQVERHTIGSQLARQEAEGRYILSDGSPTVVLKHPANPTREQREAVREGYELRHTGRTPGRPGMVWGGWDLQPLAVSARDAQFIESMNYGVRDVARMLGVPSDFLEVEAPDMNSTPELDNTRLLRFGIAPWQSRLEQGLAHDPDLFPAGDDFNVEFDPVELLRADIKTRYEAYRLARQGGWITSNEIRADEGREPVDGGDEIQVTPVGGAPNADDPATPATPVAPGSTGDPAPAA